MIRVPNGLNIIRQLLVGTGGRSHEVTSMRGFVTPLLALAVLVTSTTAAQALPDATRDNDLGVNGPVRAVLEAGGHVWVGGQFTQVVKNQGTVVNVDAETNLAAFDLAGNTALNIGPKLGGTSSIVYDLSLGADGLMYVAGKFNGDGATNLVAVNPESGAVVQAYTISTTLYSVHRDATTLWAGARTALYNVTGPTTKQTAVSVATQGGTPERPRTPQVSDIISAPQGGVFIACKCDTLGGEPSKAFAHITASGGYDTTWRPDAGVNAFGWEIALSADGTVAYLAAGGSDFVEAVQTTDAATVWKRDVNGQAQSVTVSGNRLLVGGHFRLVEDYCQPRLAALDLANGRLDTSWTPAPNPKYPGVWSVIDVTGSVWAGGEFTKMGTDWQRDSSGGCVYKVVNGVPDDSMPLVSGTNLSARNLAVFAG